MTTRLTLHQAQRQQSIPTLSVLVGRAIAARQLWTQWLHEARRPTAVCVYDGSVALFEAWLTTIAQHNDLRSRIIQKIAALAHQPADQLATWLTHTSRYQRQLFWQRVSPLGEAVPVLRSLLDSLPAATASPVSHVSAQWLASTEMPEVLKSFATVAQCLPPAALPGLFVQLPDPANRSAPPAALTVLTQLVEAVPIIPVGLVLTAAQGSALLDRLPESKAKAMVRSGLIEVPAPAPDRLRQWLRDRGVTDQARLQPILHLVERHGTTAEALEIALALIDPAGQPDSAAADALYRSQAEKFLFQYLQAHPTTAGRFRPNAQLDIQFGNRPMEVDFLDAAAKIVIELDGHYHFKSLDNYRRDRRKDRILQQQGFLVLRFLSEDVVSDLEGILDAIDQALASRPSSVINRSEA